MSTQFFFPISGFFNAVFEYSITSGHIKIHFYVIEFLILVLMSWVSMLAASYHIPKNEFQTLNRRYRHLRLRFSIFLYPKRFISPENTPPDTSYV